MKLIDLLPGRVAGLALVTGALIAAVTILVVDARRATPAEPRSETSAQRPDGVIVLRQTMPVSGRY
jgi:hypothetical protein